MLKTLTGLIVAGFALSGCASSDSREFARNDYARFFTPEAGVTAESIAAMRAAPPTGSPEVVPVAKWDPEIARNYARQGYVLVASSSFTSGRPESDRDAIAVGTRLGADLIVILAPEYQGTVSTSVPITLPSATTSYTNGSATAYVSGGPVTAYGNSTTTTYGTSTTYLPMTVQRSAYGAGYFVKWHFRFGAHVSDLSDAERQQLQTNRGVHVDYVIDNTPAYNSDILPGDVIVGVNGQTANNQTAFGDIITANRGQTVDVTLIRAGKTLAKRVSLLE